MKGKEGLASASPRRLRVCDKALESGRHICLLLWPVLLSCESPQEPAEWTRGLWGCEGQATASGFGGLPDFLFDTFPPLGISTTLIHEAGQAYITFSVYPQTFSSTEDYVFRGTKNIFCMLTPPGRLPGRLFPHLPLPFSSGSFCCSHSAKQIFCSLATCRSLCQAVKQIPGASGTVVLLGGDCG